MWAGNYSPSFGVSPELAPSAFSVEFADEYEERGRVGFGGAWQFIDGDSGRHALSLHTYAVESEILNASSWQNTGDNAPTVMPEFGTLSHFSAALDGGIPSLLPKLSYHIAARHQAWGEESVTDEFGYVAALHGKIELTGGMNLDPYLEYAHFDDDGDAQTKWRYLTFGVAGERGPWNLSLTYSGRDAQANDPDKPVDKQRLRQLLLRYTFLDGATVNLSHQRDGAGIDAIESMSFRVAVPL